MKKMLIIAIILTIFGPMSVQSSGPLDFLAHLSGSDFKNSNLVSAQEKIVASFEIVKIPTEPVFLFVKGRKGGNSKSCSIKISLNGKTIAREQSKFPDMFWGINRYPIRRGLLRIGQNQIIILNEKERNSSKEPASFMISECYIAGSSFTPPYDLLTDYSFQLPKKRSAFPEALAERKGLPAFAIRGTKGWAWAPEQYLAEIPYLKKFRMNFLMNCYTSMFSDPEKFINNWWEPIPEPKKRAYEQVVRACQESGIIFCFSFHPQLFSERPLEPKSEEDFEKLWQHYAWMQSLGVKWFMVSYDDIPVQGQNIVSLGEAHASLVNKILSRLREKDTEAQMIFCPVYYAGPGDNGDARLYLEALAKILFQDVFIFWTGDGVVTAAITRQCAERYKNIVKHRLIIWDNYPVNDRNPVLHLGPVTGRDPDLCEIAYGYMSNPLCPQNEINRIPLFTSADYAYNPKAYDPLHSIGQAIINLAETPAQRRVLKDLVELYPGMLIYGQPRTNFNSVLERFERIIQEPNAQSMAASFISRVEDVASRLSREFPGRYQKTLETIDLHIKQMKEKFASLESPNFPQEIPYGTGIWDTDSLGNHRIVLKVSEKADAVWAHIPWRRRDYDPEKKNLIIIDAASQSRINNLCRVEINREYCDLVFQPQNVPGQYYVYYLPYKILGRSNYPKVIYPEPEQTADPAWLERHGLPPKSFSPVIRNDFPQAQVLEIQSIDEFNSFFPMEVIAASEELRSLLLKYPDSSYLLFLEERRFPIRMTDDLPFRWIKAGTQNIFSGEAARGEFYAFQVGVFACKEAIEDIDVYFSPMKGEATKTVIPASSFSCFNTGGVDWTGKRFKKKCPVEKGKIQALWCGIQIPRDIPSGKYEGELKVAPKGMKESVMKIILTVKEEILEDAGDSEPWRYSRLRWLDSTIGLDDEIVAPFTPMKLSGNTVSCLGRMVSIAETGFPKSIKSFFAPEMTRLMDKGREVLAAPLNLIVESSDDKILPWEGSGVKIVRQAPGVVAWESRSTAGPWIMDCQARMEFDGNIEYEVRLTASVPLSVKDIRLEIPVFKDVAKYMMGMGFKGGYRAAEYDWKWDQKNNQESVWVGDVNAGLQCSFKDENYSRPLNTNFYLLKPLNMPPSWHNQGKGGCHLREKDKDTFLITAYSGSREIKGGEELHFNFRLLITPFKVLDTKAQWKTRFYHSFKPVKEIAATGANTINVHHANEINPYINYPFLRPKEMKAYIDEAHKLGMKVKIYYTVRELSNRAPEIFALRSLGDEILSYGHGGGFCWLQEHLGSNYIAGWFVPELKDAAVINSGVSRWHNYYLEGLNWLVRNVGIDGLYIDDVAFDRTVMKRVRKILDRGSKASLIDLHSANQFNPRDGFANSANLYLEHFPYINRLWFGEYFDYNSPPDFWLVEVSGIPFGLMGEMLQDGGNPWRGMLYGMTSRMPWSGNPSHLWKVWDEFGIQDSEMIGYWSPSCPVKTNSKDILATAYVKKDKVLISIASWAKESKSCRLEIDWNSLGLDSEKAWLVAPQIEDFQDSALFKPTDEIPVEPGKGWLLILSEKDSGFAHTKWGLSLLLRGTVPILYTVPAQPSNKRLSYEAIIRFSVPLIIGKSKASESLASYYTRTKSSLAFF